MMKRAFQDTSTPRMLNVGCGPTFHKSWVNIDIAPQPGGVIRHDLTIGLPFDTGTFEACYCSHVLEHLTPAEGRNLISEMFRVLRPDGVARIVVPDLEQVVRMYLELLDELTGGQRRREADYDWVVVEMYDQAVRNQSGGEMAKLLISPDLCNKDFVLSRIGEDARIAWSENPAKRKPLVKRLADLGLLGIMNKLRIRVAAIVVRVLAGRKAGFAFEEGLFRRSGEIHRWAYDRFSVTRLMHRAGFDRVAVCSASQSAIPMFSSFCLDTDSAGSVRKPDSLFVEGRRPRHNQGES